jgi:murein DD-endopeptidase MepM/ murein hydrolase activator NlpD
MYKAVTVTLCLFLLLTNSLPVIATDGTEQPTYIVQPGDNLYSIARRFGTSIEELTLANNLSNPNEISVGTELIIPGLTGVSGLITTSPVTLGETIRTISITREIPLEVLTKINRITSPSEIYPGSELILPESQSIRSGWPMRMQNKISIIETTAAGGINPWVLLETNQKTNSWSLISGSEVVDKTPIGDSNPFEILPGVLNIQLQPLPIMQGSTVKIIIKTVKPLNLVGKLGEKNLAFFMASDNTYIALQGIHALAQPGLINFSISSDSLDGGKTSLDQSILLLDGNFPQDPPIIVPPETLDPAITAPEESQIVSTASTLTPEKYWEGVFIAPIDNPCVRSAYGNRRSYNDGVYTGFHTGVDFGVCATNLNIYAPASGKVVLVVNQSVRGNATIIDHGWGVFSGFWHQSEVYVKPGDLVTAGQIIGQIGNTGRSTGPHLHWDLWVGGVEVDPLEWLNNTYP